VRKAVTDADNWLFAQLQQQDKLTKTVTPSLTCAAVDQKYRELMNTCEPIMTKPKPKVEPKPEEKPQEKPAENAQEKPSGEANAANANEKDQDSDTPMKDAERSNRDDQKDQSQAEEDNTPLEPPVDPMEVD